MSFVDAWIIEAVAQLVRTGTFFIPASIGAQEGAFMLVCAAMTGSPALGVAVAVGFEFDVPVRFDTDILAAQFVSTFELEVPQVVLRELRSA